ncbi:cytochrome P450 [Bailinhaonella thermotolerans]|uniref:Cytochrome P450 n=1 Tax=Bailinhaonella thermotolerans TaxID=1070861 RepID=A0A3A4B2T6_9ACTN|nr:cytochrome P450 [Bailinhaonella thermotolerans]RJL35471.1 cytochrome P450 [Bailinhaonella thermotolerans]
MSSPPSLPFDRPDPLRPDPRLRELQATGPVHRVRTAVGDPAWLVTGYEQVRRLLDDPRLGRSHPAPETAARTGRSALFGGPQGAFDTEHADHTRMRALLRPHFSPKRMRALIPRVEALTTSLLDELEEHGPPADLHAALAVPLPIAVICELLGVPYADREKFRVWTHAAADVTDNARSLRGLGELFAYGQGLVARKRAEGGDDIIARLAATDGVSDDEAAAMGMFLLFAGHETTVNAIGQGTLRLLAEPGRWRSLAADPDRIGPAIEEMLRGTGGDGTGIPRYARADLDIDGTHVHAGDLVLLDLGAANHDPAAFPDPGRFDPARPATHLSFGHGARYCIGAPLARIELTAVFSQLIPRFPAMRLAVPGEELTFDRATLTRSLTALPVTW